VSDYGDSFVIIPRKIKLKEMIPINFTLNLALLTGKKISYKAVILLLIPLALSAFTHLWNIVGFPAIHPDEGVYLRRAMLVLRGLGPHDPAARFDHSLDTTSSYDHPYFGQIFLAWVLGAIGYPNSLHPSTDAHSIEMLYAVPRVVMGILAVVDTFLVYKICELRYSYNKNIAFIASVLFAVTPLSWLNRWILLDNILLPFFLSSILFAVYCKRYPKDSIENNYNYILTLLSGISLGLAIYTKIPAFTMIPMIGFFIYTNNNRNLKTLGLWFIPVIMIPMLWPLYSISAGQFGLFWSGLMYQTNRTASTNLFDSIYTSLQMDPFLVSLGIIGIAFAAIKKDLMPLLWVMPFTIFLYLVPFTQYYYVVPVLPAFCIAAAVMIGDLSNTLKIKKNFRSLQVITVSAIAIFGLASITMLITRDMNFTFFKLYAYIVKLLPNSGDNKESIIGTHWWIWTSFWISKYVFHKQLNVIDLVYHRDAPGIVTEKLSGETVHFVRFPLNTSKVIFFGDENVRNIFSMLGSDDPLLINVETRNNSTFVPLQQIYDNTLIKATFNDINSSNYQGYPNVNIASMTINENRPQGKIEIRANN
jgi:hypothetical protein